MSSKILTISLFVFMLPILTSAQTNLNFVQGAVEGLQSVNKVKTFDFNQDGLDDIITLGSKVNVLLNSSSTLSLVRSYTTVDSLFKVYSTNNVNDFYYSQSFASPRDFDIGDVNNDGVKDIIVANNGEPDVVNANIYGAPGGISVLLGSINSTFNLSQSLQLNYVNDNLKKIKLVDIDNDNDLDAVSLTDIYSERVSLIFFTNNGSGTFIEQNRLYLDSASTTQGREIDFVVSDIESDGDVDIIVTYNQELRVFTNNGFGNFFQSLTYSGLQSTKARQIQRIISPEIIDYDKDGDDDIVILMRVTRLFNPSVLGNSYNNVSIILQTGFYTNNGSGVYSFTEGELIPLLGVSSLLINDVNSDGNKDIVVSGINPIILSNSESLIMMGNGTSSLFIPTKFLSNFVPRNPGAYLYKAEALNLNNDLKTDIAYSDNYGSLYTFTQVENVLNSAPVIIPIQAKIIQENQLLSFVVSATDPDNNEILLSASNLPSGASFNPNTGLFSWTPSYSSDRSYQVKFTATENTPNALFDNATVTIDVINVNQAPSISQIGNKVISEGNTLSFAVTASDPDGDNVILSASNLPAGAIFNQLTGVFTWDTNFYDAGNYNDIQFIATDNGSPLELDLELITITVGDVNRKPNILNPGPQTIVEGDTLSFVVTASDPDNDLVVMSVNNLPVGATFSSTTGTFSWNTNLNDAGNYTVNFTATDNGIPVENSSLGVVISVGNKPSPNEQVITLINNIVSSGLTKSLENSYLANLQKVEQFINEGKIITAINQLNAFKNKVNQDYNQGKISLVQKNQFLLSANNIINDLNN